MLPPSTVASILTLPTVEDLSNFFGEFEIPYVRRWQAVTADDVAAIPPDEYLLDAAITYRELYGEISSRAMRGGSGIAALTQELPQCDICKNATARYDTGIVPGTGWAFMCEACFKTNSNRVLGTGAGQYLFTVAELTGPIRQVLDHITKICEPEEDQ